MDEAMRKRWRELSEEILCSMKKWLVVLPKTMFREIEEVFHERMSWMKAQLQQETTMASELTD